MNDFYYRKLQVYHKAMTLVTTVYKLSSAFHQSERYALSDQIQRAVISVPSNIAEGMGRMAVKERIHFLEISYASMTEVLCQLDISQSVGYISEEELENCRYKGFALYVISAADWEKLCKKN